MQNNFEHLYCLGISSVDKTLRLAFNDAFPGARLRSLTLDSESEVYFKNFPLQKLALLYKCSRAGQRFRG